MPEMTRGSLVVCIYDFENERTMYNHPYPQVGDYLTVSGSLVNWSTREVLLTFEELKGKMPIPLSAMCFRLVQTAEDGRDAIRSLMKH